MASIGYENCELIGAQVIYETNSEWEGTVLHLAFRFMSGPREGQRVLLQAGPLQHVRVKFPDAPAEPQPVTDEDDEPWEDD